MLIGLNDIKEKLGESNDLDAINFLIQNDIPFHRKGKKGRQILTTLEAINESLSGTKPNKKKKQQPDDLIIEIE